MENKSFKLREINFKTYALCEPIDEIGYNLLIRDENGIVIRSQYHKWKTKAKQMTEITISSPYWKSKENLEIGDSFTIMGEGESRPFPTKEDPNNIVWDFQLKKSDGIEKSCRLNNKILKDLKAEFGADMGAWIGKEIKAIEMNKLAKGYQIVWSIVK